MPTTPATPNAAPNPLHEELQRSPRNHILLRAPLAMPAGGLICGIALADQLAPPPWALILPLAAAALLAAPLLRRPLTLPLQNLLAAAIFLAALAAGLALGTVHLHRFPPDHLAQRVGDQPLLLDIRGHLLTDPLPIQPAGTAGRAAPTASRALIQIHAVHGTDPGLAWEPASGTAQCILIGTPPGWARDGAAFQATAEVSRILPPANPGELNIATLQRRQRVLLNARITANDAFEPLDAPDLAADKPRWFRGLYRQWATAALYDQTSLDAQQQGLVAAMVLGRRSEIDQALEQAFTQTGTTHLVSVSGFHLTFLAMLAYAATALATRRPAARGVAVIAIVAAYLLLAEPRAALIRAAIVCVAACAALIAGRQPAPFNALCTAACITLLLNPADLFNPGFQLSYASLLGLTHLSPILRQAILRRLDQPLPPRLANRMTLAERAPRELLRRTGQALCVSTAAALPGSLIAWFHFGAFSLLAPLHTLILALPVAAILVLGYLKLILSAAASALPGLVSLPLHLLAAVVAWPLAQFTALLTWLTPLLASLPGLIDPPAPSPWILAAALLLMATWAVRKQLGQRGIWAAAVCLTGYTLSLTQRDLPPDNTIRIDLLSTGHGRILLVQDADDARIAIDAGATPSFANRRLQQILHHQRLWRIHTLLITTLRPDRTDALLALHRAAPIANTLIPASPDDPRIPGTTQLALRLLARQAQPPRTIAPGDQIHLRGGVLTILANANPPQAPPKRNSSDSNKPPWSILRIQLADRPDQAVILCGDASAHAVLDLVAAGLAGQVDLSARAVVLPLHADLHDRQAYRLLLRASGAAWAIHARGAGQSPWPAEDLPPGVTLLDTEQVGALRLELSAGQGFSLQGLSGRYRHE